MSCGCGGKGGLPLHVQTRLECARLALSAMSGAHFTNDEVRKAFADLAQKAYDFAAGGEDLSKILSPALPLAIGDSAEAVTSRNAMMHALISHVGALSAEIVSKLRVSGVHSLGQLIQWSENDLVAARLDGAERAHVKQALEHYALSLDMKNDAIREWIVSGPSKD